MPTATVQKELYSARTFGAQLEEIVVSKRHVPNDERNTLLIAYWALMFDYHKGILSCAQRGLSGSAFALVRPVVEAVVRSHIAIKGSAEELATIRNDDYKVNFKTIGPRIDADFGLGHLMENFLNEVTRNALHSYTHSGLLQLGRRFEGNDLKPSYTDEEITEVIRVATCAVFMVTNLVMKHFGFEDEWEKVGQMFEEWGRH